MRFSSIEPEAGSDHAEDTDHGASDQGFFDGDESADGDGDGGDEWAGDEEELDAEEGGHSGRAIESCVEESGGEFGAFFCVIGNECLSDAREGGLYDLSDIVNDVLFIICGCVVAERTEPLFGAFSAFPEQHIKQAGEAAGHGCSEEYGDPHRAPRRLRFRSRS